MEVVAHNLPSNGQIRFGAVLRLYYREVQRSFAFQMFPRAAQHCVSRTETSGDYCTTLDSSCRCYMLSTSEAVLVT
jgi:hypothetical protein